MKKLLVCCFILVACPAFAQIGMTMGQAKAARAAAATAGSTTAGTAGTTTTNATGAATTTTTNPLSLTADQRTIIKNAVYGACYQKAHMSIDMQAISKQLNVDVPVQYCTCMSTSLAQGMTDDDLAYFSHYKHMSPDLENRLTSDSRSCMPTATAANNAVKN